MHYVVSSVAKKTNARGRRAIIAKNEAEMSRGIKVVAQLEKVKSTLEKESGTAVTLNFWLRQLVLMKRFCSMICTLVGIAGMNFLKVVVPWYYTFEIISRTRTSTRRLNAAYLNKTGTPRNSKGSSEEITCVVEEQRGS